MKIAELRFQLQVAAKGRTQDDLDIDATAVKSQLLSLLKENDMASYWESCAAQFNWGHVDVSSMKAKNEAKLKEFDATIQDAVENLGENDVIDGLLAKADYLFKVGDKDATVAAYLAAKDKVSSYLIE